MGSKKIALIMGVKWKYDKTIKKGAWPTQPSALLSR